MSDLTSTPVGIIQTALRYLAARCDGAHDQDGVGFSKPDSFLGKRLASYETLSENQVIEALDLLKKYAASQLKPAGIVLPDSALARQDALDIVIAAGHIHDDGDYLKVSFLYNQRHVDAIKSIKTAEGQQAARFNGTDKTWRIAKSFGADVLAVFPRFAIDDTLRAALKTGDVEAPPEGRITLKGDTLLITFEYDPAKVAEVKTLPGARWNSPNAGAWNVPADHADRALALFPTFKVDPAVTTRIEGLKAAQVADQQISASLSDRIETTLPNGRTLYAHQVEGVKFLLDKRRGILAFDMGTGKTLTALVAAKAYQMPVYVVCPASLRINWQREAEMVGLSIQTYSWAKLPAVPDHDFVLICDEAHYAQSLKSSRTKAMLALAKAEHCKGLMLLTGTPIKNGRPANLYPLLTAVRADVAANRRTFEQRYCDAHPTRFTQWDTSGASNLDELHVKCKPVMLRKLKKDCLDLPAKTRVLRGVELSDSAKNIYAESLATLKAEYHKRVAEGTISDQSEAIVMLNHLRHAGSIAKVETATELAQDVIEAGQQIVLFVAFKASGELLARALNCSLLSGDATGPERQRMVDDFQAGITKALVCTHGAGGVGITLTAAQTVVLVDRPWTPGDALQSEDRLHRIGQQNAVTAIWLQHGTIDEAVDQILQDKQERIELVLEGKRKTMRGTGGSPADIAQELLPFVFE